jgi:hypothetical protein
MYLWDLGEKGSVCVGDTTFRVHTDAYVYTCECNSTSTYAAILPPQEQKIIGSNLASVLGFQDSIGLYVVICT